MLVVLLPGSLCSYQNASTSTYLLEEADHVADLHKNTRSTREPPGAAAAAAGAAVQPSEQPEVRRDLSGNKTAMWKRPNLQEGHAVHPGGVRLGAAGAGAAAQPLVQKCESSTSPGILGL